MACRKCNHHILLEATVNIEGEASYRDFRTPNRDIVLNDEVEAIMARYDGGKEISMEDKDLLEVYEEGNFVADMIRFYVCPKCKTTMVGNDLEVGGITTDFIKIPWASLTEEEES